MIVFLQEIGESIYTIREVISEIRDKVTRQRLQVLPYELKFKEPSTECIRIGMTIFIIASYMQRLHRLR